MCESILLMRGMIVVAVLMAVLAGCGDDNAGSPPQAPKATVAPAQAATTAVPAPRDLPQPADGSTWPEVPKVLLDSVPGDVVVAGRMSEAEQRSLLCPGALAVADARPVDALFDEFALVATWRDTGEAGQVEGMPVVSRCALRWRGGWQRDEKCAHYAPARSQKMIERSGGGLAYCDGLADTTLAMLFVVPPKGTRWAVVERREGYSIAYPVREGTPVNLAFQTEETANAQEFEYIAVERDGEARRQRVKGALAG